MVNYKLISLVGLPCNIALLRGPEPWALKEQVAGPPSAPGPGTSAPCRCKRRLACSAWNSRILKL